MYIYMCIQMCIYVYIITTSKKGIYIYIYMCIQMCIYVYVCVYVYLFVHILVYIYGLNVYLCVSECLSSISPKKLHFTVITTKLERFLINIAYVDALFIICIIIMKYLYMLTYIYIHTYL
jgi:hypothetical protein